PRFDPPLPRAVEGALRSLCVTRLSRSARWSGERRGARRAEVPGHRDVRDAEPLAVPPGTPALGDRRSRLPGQRRSRPAARSSARGSRALGPSGIPRGRRPRDRHAGPRAASPSHARLSRLCPAAERAACAAPGAGADRLPGHAASLIERSATGWFAPASLTRAGRGRYGGRMPGRISHIDVRIDAIEAGVYGGEAVR